MDSYGKALLAQVTTNLSRAHSEATFTSNPIA